ncbi:hypothetical protein JYU34_008125 [Plutella xylostella]|uniref:Uncharacterized protein n=1 Tax=Plutella xylostella TaxID=51655 RepID=A0ABQ7QNT3_PLUXY|nr:hypothetical protein JYU34_008125 [Plutella xylostella]
MALCSSQLDSAMPQIKRDDSSEPEGEMSATASPEGSSSQDNKPNLQPNPLYGLNPEALEKKAKRQYKRRGTGGAEQRASEGQAWEAPQDGPHGGGHDGVE